MKLVTKKQVSTPESVVSPVLGSFDLSGGAFRKSESTRRVLIVFSIISAAALTGLILTGVVSDRKASSDNEAILAAKSQAATLSAQLNQIDQSEGYPASTLQQHIQVRQPTYVGAVQSEVSVPQMVSAIQNATPPGLKIVSIEVSWAAGSAAAPVAAPNTSGAPPAQAPGRPPTSAQDNPAPGEEAPADEPRPPGMPAADAAQGGNPAAPAQEAAPAPVSAAPPVTVTVVAVGNFDDIRDMKYRLESLPQLENMSTDPTWTGSGLETTVTFVFQVSPEALSTRAAAALAADPFGQPKAGS